MLNKCLSLAAGMPCKIAGPNFPTEPCSALYNTDKHRHTLRSLVRGSDHCGNAYSGRVDVSHLTERMSHLTPEGWKGGDKKRDVFFHSLNSFLFFSMLKNNSVSTEISTEGV